MWENEDLYNKYDLLLPSKFEGGYLILALYQKIKCNVISDYFTTNDIKFLLEEISQKYEQNVPQSERIIKNLLHYFLRTIPDEYGKYCLTDHAKKLVELMLYKLDNPYKKYPLKESFDKYFTIRFSEIKTITDLELKFGREFVEGYKRIINDHLEALQDELTSSYTKLNTILRSDELSATHMVRQFVDVFKEFSDRAEDITTAVSSKDKFLRDLRKQVDKFYSEIQEFKHPENEEEKIKFSELKANWEIATEIQNDLEDFFLTVDKKINHIRKQILNASGKLSELHENFSSRSTFRLLIKRLLHLALDSAYYFNEEISFHSTFPVKGMVFERTQLFYPEYYNFETPKSNIIIIIPRDVEYEQQQREEIEKEIKRQEIINNWIVKGIEILNQHQRLELNALMKDILEQEKDFTIAYSVIIELSQYISSCPEYDLLIKQELEILKNHNVFTWKMEIEKT